MERERQLENMLIESKKQRSLAQETLKNFKLKVALEKKRAQQQLSDAHKKNEELTKEWKKTTDSIALQASYDLNQTNEESCSVVEKLRRQVAAQVVSNQILEYQLTSSQEKKKVEHLQLQELIKRIKHNIQSMRDYLINLIKYVRMMLEMIFLEIKNNIELLVDNIQKSNIHAAAIAELARIMLHLRELTIALTNKCHFILPETNQTDVLQTLNNAILPSIEADENSDYNKQYNQIVIIASILPSLMEHMKDNLSIFEKKLKRKALQTDSEPAKKQELEQCSTKIVKEYSQENKNTNKGSKVNNKRVKQKQSIKQLKSTNEQCTQTSRVCLEEVVAKVYKKRVYTEKDTATGKQSVGNLKQCYCHGCGRGPYTMPSNRCSHCEKLLRFPVMACLPLSPCSQALYNKRAHNWLTRVKKKQPIANLLMPAVGCLNLDNLSLHEPKPMLIAPCIKLDLHSNSEQTSANDKRKINNIKKFLAPLML